MMSQVQASDAYPSSVPDGDQIEYLPFDLPQDPQGLYTPDPSCSQPTIYSSSDPDYARPRPQLPKPETLERVYPDRTSPYILYSEIPKDAFVACWLETEFGKKKRIHWDGRHHAKCWEHFEQVAPTSTLGKCVEVYSDFRFYDQETSILTFLIVDSRCVFQYQLAYLSITGTP